MIGKSRRWVLASAALLCALLTGCASISPERQDVVIVDGRLALSGGDCGTIPQARSGYFYVCDMSLEVRRVVFGQHPRGVVTARFFFLETDRADEIVVGPDWTSDRRAAAILWRRDDGTQGSYVLAPFPGRWCVPAWMPAQFSISNEEVALLDRAGYPLCSAAQ